ncbi:MAG: deoxyribose-phosphate aldolase [Paludibacteraceae bacterium]|jgi:deoxyribose-phosphate aldolase|nr:deoxyribose-phosphate aldolase [Paludibacteraceae bacterium]
MKDFKELFESYPLPFSLESIKADVKNIIDKRYEQADRLSTCKELFAHLELTSLKVTDTEDSIKAWIEKVNDLDENFPELSKPMGICVYPSLVETVKNSLTEDVKIVTVIGFPSSQTYLEVKLAETALALSYGADEIDMVLPVGKFLQGNYEEVFDEISEIKACCRGAKLKVILETGALDSIENIYKAAILAMEAGADFIKTSTGKDAPTNLYHVYAMCKAIDAYYKQTQTKVGIKVAGGVTTKQDALLYYCVISELLDEEWTSPDLFRIGASKLANNLLTEIEKEEVTYF